MVENAENNVFVIDVIIEKVDISVLQKHMVYDIKKLHNKRVVWSMKKCFLNIFLKVSFFYYYIFI